MCRQRRLVARSLADTECVIDTLERLVGAILHAFAFFAYLALFGADVGRLVISLSSMAVRGLARPRSPPVRFDSDLSPHCHFDCAFQSLAACSLLSMQCMQASCDTASAGQGRVQLNDSLHISGATRVHVAEALQSAETLLRACRLLARLSLAKVSVRSTRRFCSCSW